MKVHLTGMSPRTASQQTRERITFAGLLERALAVEGHIVIRDIHPGVEPDFVIVGLASALSPGATYALVGLEAIGRAIEGGTPLLLLVDDPDLGKIKNGVASVLRAPHRLYSDYLMLKRVKGSRNPSEEQRARIDCAVEMLAGERWPPALLPMHAWAIGTEAMLAKRLGVETGVVPLDMSSMLGDARDVVARFAEARARMWFTERHYSPAVLAQERVTWPVVPVDSSTMGWPEEVYAATRGVHQGLAGTSPGWWTPTPRWVAQAGTVYLMDSADQMLVASDSPYYLTPDYVESLSDSEHAALADQQRTYLRETTWSLDRLLSRLMDLTGSTSSFAPLDTTTTS